MKDEEKKELEELEKKKKELKRKIQKRNTKRFFLILLNAILASYLVYCLYDTGLEFYRKHFESDSSNIISIGGYSESRSLDIYNKVIDKDENGNFQTIEAVDFSFIGGYLNFKSCNNMQKEDGTLLFSSFETYTLRYITEEGKYEKSNPYTDINNYINKSIFLFDNELKEGDYIIYPYAFEINKEQTPLKIESQKGINEVYYSPIIDGKRRQINIKSKASSPALVITIKNIYAPEKTYNDIAILYENDEDKSALLSIFDEGLFSTKYIFKSQSQRQDLISLYNAKATVSLIINSGSDIVLSHYFDISSLSNNYEIPVYKNDTLSNEDSISCYDEDMFIRELGGHIFNAGSALSTSDGSTKYLSGYKNEFDMGSIAIHVGIKSIDKLKPLLEHLVNFNFTN